MKQTDLLPLLPGKSTAVSLDLPDGLEYDEWRVALYRLVQLKEFSQFAIGDALNYGEAHYGEMYVQAASDTGLSPDTLMILKHVATKVPAMMRIKNWTACREVAKLEHKEQKKWLKDFVKHGWTVKELKDGLTAAGLRRTRENNPENNLQKIVQAGPVIAHFVERGMAAQQAVDELTKRIGYCLVCRHDLVEVTPILVDACSGCAGEIEARKEYAK